MVRLSNHEHLCLSFDKALLSLSKDLGRTWFNGSIDYVANATDFLMWVLVSTDEILFFVRTKKSIQKKSTQWRLLPTFLSFDGGNSHALSARENGA